MITTVNQPPSLSLFAGARARIAALPRIWRALAAAVLLAPVGYQAVLALETPGQSLRRELVAAADEAGALPWNRSPEQVRHAIGRYFADHAVTVDSRRFPVEVLVAVQNIDRTTCAEASEVAQRIEGSVVVALDGFRSAADCGDENRMVWHIMP
ncbi:MAG TPA: hypothetical protein VLX85_02885 [Stellaceae bacterium]|nr:hypothetical protein [Stellaceae bacterium]